MAKITSVKTSADNNKLFTAQINDDNSREFKEYDITSGINNKSLNNTADVTGFDEGMDVITVNPSGDKFVGVDRRGRDVVNLSSTNNFSINSFNLLSSFKVDRLIQGKVIFKIPGEYVYDTTFNDPEVSGGDVYTTAFMSNGRIAIGGNFTSVKGVQYNNFAILNRDGSLVSSLNIDVNGFVRKIFYNEATDQLIIAGDFNTVNGLTRNGVFILNSDLTLNTDTNTYGITTGINAMTVGAFINDIVLVGSRIWFIGRDVFGDDRLIVRRDANNPISTVGGSWDPPYYQHTQDSVVGYSDGLIFGDSIIDLTNVYDTEEWRENRRSRWVNRTFRGFKFINTGLGRVDSDADYGINNGTVYDVTNGGSYRIIVGDFVSSFKNTTTVNGRVSYITSSGGSLAHDKTFNNVVRAVQSVRNPNLTYSDFFGGDFTSIGGNNYLVKLNRTSSSSRVTTIDTTFPSVNGIVRNITKENLNTSALSDMIISGDFTQVGGNNMSKLFRVTPNTINDLGNSEIPFVTFNNMTDRIIRLNSTSSSPTNDFTSIILSDGTNTLTLTPSQVNQEINANVLKGKNITTTYNLTGNKDINTVLSEYNLTINK